MDTQKHISSKTGFLLIFILPIIGLILGVGVTFLFGINQTDYSNLVANIFLLTACVILIRLFNFSAEDLGLRVIQPQGKRHVILSLVIFAVYLLIYIFGIRISALKTITISTLWSLLTYLVVVIAEELYFRGILYSFFEKRFSSKTALVVSSLVFGLFHARQGARNILLKSITGWLWGSIRYSTGMIFLIIFPIHFAYNSIWLLFEGNWNNPPAWVIVLVPGIEVLLGLAIVFLKNKNSPSRP